MKLTTTRKIEQMKKPPTVNDLFSESTLVTAHYLFFPAISLVTVHNIHIFVMTFEFVFIYRHIYRKWVFLVDSKCRNTVILTRLTYTLSRKVFHDRCAKRGTFFHQILNKNSLSLAHCALNRSFTVFPSIVEYYWNTCDLEYL